jgi:hypothetical protein
MIISQIIGNLKTSYYMNIEYYPIHQFYIVFGEHIHQLYIIFGDYDTKKLIFKH